MPQHISELKNCEKGNDIYVLASGKSLDFIPPEFFANKVTIGVGDLYASKYAPKYTVMKEQMSIQNALQYHTILIVSMHDCGNYNGRLNAVDTDKAYYYFDHLSNDTQVHLEELDGDRIIVSWTTMTSAIHLAYYLGAANIILAGHDCGQIDGETNISGYWNLFYTDQHQRPSESWYKSWLGQISPASELLAKEIRKRGVPVVSINPFINMQLEGHKYEAIR